MIKTALLVAICFVLTFGATAQKKPVAKAPVTTIEAETKDGRAVLLRSDGTWKFDDTRPSTAPVTMAKGANVDFQAAMIFKSGDVVPVPRAEFYLLSRSLQDVLATKENLQILIDDIRAANRSPSDAELTEMIVKRYEAMKLSGYIKDAMRGSLSKRYIETADPIITGVTKYKTKTDFQGNGSFKDVPAGDYYLFGWADIRKNFVSWHLKITVAGSDQKIVLDTNNMLP